MYAGVTPYTEQSLRDRALLLGMLDTGARAGEVVVWQVGDFDKVAGSLLIRHSKSNRQRMVYLDKTAKRALVAYLKLRDTNSVQPLFATRNGEHFELNGLRRIVQKRAKQAGVPVPRLHDFRRAFALNMLRAGVDVFALQKLMGNSDLITLRRYLAQNGDDLQVAHFKKPMWLV